MQGSLEKVASLLQNHCEEENAALICIYLHWTQPWLYSSPLFFWKLTWNVIHMYRNTSSAEANRIIPVHINRYWLSPSENHITKSTTGVPEVPSPMLSAASTFPATRGLAVQDLAQILQQHPQGSTTAGSKCKTGLRADMQAPAWRQLHWEHQLILHRLQNIYYDFHSPASKSQIDWVQCKKPDRQKGCRAIWKAMGSWVPQNSLLFFSTTKCKSLHIGTRGYVAFSGQGSAFIGDWTRESLANNQLHGSQQEGGGRVHCSAYINTEKKICGEFWWDCGWSSTGSTSGKQWGRRSSRFRLDPGKPTLKARNETTHF